MNNKLLKIICVFLVLNIVLTVISIGLKLLQIFK